MRVSDIMLGRSYWLGLVIICFLLTQTCPALQKLLVSNKSSLKWSEKIVWSIPYSEVLSTSFDFWMLQSDRLINSMRMFPPQWSEKTGRSIPYSELLSTSCLNAHLSDYHHFPPSITPLPTTITVTTIHSDGGAAFSHGDSFTTHRVRVFSFSYLLTKLWSHQQFATRFLQICNWTIYFVKHHLYHIYTYIFHFKWLHYNVLHFFWCTKEQSVLN